MQVMSYMIRVSLQIRSATLTCPDPRSCSMDILNILSSFGWLAQSFAQIVTDCPPAYNPTASCTSCVGNAFASTVNIPAVAMAAINDCAPEPDSQALINDALAEP